MAIFGYHVLDGSLAWELELPEQFEAATRHVRPDDVRETVLVSAELGSDGVFVHEVGPGQRRTIELLGDEVLPTLAGRAGP